MNDYDRGGIFQTEEGRRICLLEGAGEVLLFWLYLARSGFELLEAESFVVIDSLYRLP